MGEQQGLASLRAGAPADSAQRDPMRDERFDLGTKREAINLALRRLAAEPLSLEGARGMRGSGWDGDLDGMRASRVG